MHRSFGNMLLVAFAMRKGNCRVFIEAPDAKVCGCLGPCSKYHSRLHPEHRDKIIDGWDEYAEVAAAVACRTSATRRVHVSALRGEGDNVYYPLRPAPRYTTAIQSWTQSRYL